MTHAIHSPSMETPFRPGSHVPAWRWLLWALFTPVVLALAPAGLLAAESLCAEVGIEIQQELTLERQAFDATMRINNGADTLPVEKVRVDVRFTDAEGNPVVATSDPATTDAAFFVKLDSLTGIADVSGTGTVAPSSDYLGRYGQRCFSA